MVGRSHEGAASPVSAPFRVFFIPFFAYSHARSIAELACQFATRGVDSTVVVTSVNGALIRRTIDRAARAGRPIRMLHYPFPAAEVGLPDGVEDVPTGPTSEVIRIQAANAARGTLELTLREHRPDAVVADFCYLWANDVARDLGIPRVFFQAAGTLPTMVARSLFDHWPHAGLADGDNSPFLVPNLPDRLEMVISELPDYLRVHGTNMEMAWKSQLESYGVVLNTFYELEPAYCDLFRQTACKQAWFCGPFMLWPRAEEEEEEEEEEEDVAAATEAEKGHQCVVWLDKQATASVIYVGFGSFLYFSKEQHWEMARGLEASGRPFLWVLNVSNFAAAGDEGWLPEGFEERVRLQGCGLIVKGWVPQIAILNHPATGACVTHLGWNSFTEALNAGLPLITWPLAFEEFFTEKLVVDILRLGLRMWDGFRSNLLIRTVAEEVPIVNGEAERDSLVKGEAIARVVSRFAAPGSADEEVEAMRKRAREHSAMLRAAVREGGSSYNDLGRLIDALRAFRHA